VGVNKSLISLSSNPSFEFADQLGQQWCSPCFDPQISLHQTTTDIDTCLLICLLHDFFPLLLEAIFNLHCCLFEGSFNFGNVYLKAVLILAMFIETSVYWK
jgi:hypothetical protein